MSLAEFDRVNFQTNMPDAPQTEREVAQDKADLIAIEISDKTRQFLKEGGVFPQVNVLTFQGNGATQEAKPLLFVKEEEVMVPAQGDYTFNSVVVAINPFGRVGWYPKTKIDGKDVLWWVPVPIQPYPEEIVAMEADLNNAFSQS